jgi:hypothetical protein
MFAPDVVTLRQFYHSPFGEQVRALIDATLTQLWPEARGDVVLAIGYGAPYMEKYIGQATPLMLCMPAQQGAVYWPPERENLSFMAHESELPLQENSVNRILLIHSVENSEQLMWMMKEAWRVLTPGGRVLAVVPNRLSFWSRSARSPFGYGRPFSMAQLRDLMLDHQFTPTRTASAVFIPPTYFQFIWRIAPKIEKAGKCLRLMLGGVLMIEAEKQVYAAIKQPVHARKTYLKPVPVVKPVSASS